MLFLAKLALLLLLAQQRTRYLRGAPARSCPQVLPGARSLPASVWSTSRMRPMGHAMASLHARSSHRHCDACARRQTLRLSSSGGKSKRKRGRERTNGASTVFNAFTKQCASTQQKQCRLCSSSNLDRFFKFVVA